EKSHSLCPPVYITGRWNSPLGERGVKVPVDCNLLLETTLVRSTDYRQLPVGISGKLKLQITEQTKILEFSAE
ncbi:MAG: hypothetical protein OXC05_11520, partial [Halieaceae bacterium]|nr:hypothetical protein [Halieaceae bacterium]